jgi:hypothetical protein
MFLENKKKLYLKDSIWQGFIRKWMRGVGPGERERKREKERDRLH